MSSSTEYVTRENDHFDDKPATVSVAHLSTVEKNTHAAIAAALARHAERNEN